MKKWLDAVRAFVERLWDAPPPDRRLLPPAAHRNPRINVLLLRGVGWSDDVTFEALETTLDEIEGVNRIWFSCKGFEDEDVHKAHCCFAG